MITRQRIHCRPEIDLRAAPGDLSWLDSVPLPSTGIFGIKTVPHGSSSEWPLTPTYTHGSLQNRLEITLRAKATVAA